MAVGRLGATGIRAPGEIPGVWICCGRAQAAAQPELPLHPPTPPAPAQGGAAHTQQGPRNPVDVCAFNRADALTLYPSSAQENYSPEKFRSPLTGSSC